MKIAHNIKISEDFVAKLEVTVVMKHKATFHEPM